MVAHAFNPSTQEAERSGFVCDQDQPGLRIKYQGYIVISCQAGGVESLR